MARTKSSREFGDDKRITWVEQTEQLGTGHAAQDVRADELKKHHGDVFILAGDGPLIRGEVLTTLHRRPSRRARRREHGDGDAG